MAREKTREEKIKSAYRLHDFRLAESDRQVVKDQNEFGYLDSSFVGKDLFKTVLVSVVMVGLIVAAKTYLR
jgi:hypothetical protein